MIIKGTDQSSVVAQYSLVAQEIPRSFDYVTGQDLHPFIATFYLRTEARTIYTITTNAVSWQNVTPDILDTSEYPVLKIKEEIANEVQMIQQWAGAVISLNSLEGVKSTVYLDFVFGKSVISNHVTAVKPDTYIGVSWFNIAAVNDPAKSDFYYRTPTVAGVTPSADNLASLAVNADGWLASKDFSGVPVFNSHSNGPKRGGAVISDIHLVEADHYGSPVGTVFTFLASDGSLVQRTSIGYANAPASRPAWMDAININNVPGARINESMNAAQVAVVWNVMKIHLYGDLRVHVLDSPLPPTVKRYPVVGDWLFSDGTAVTAQMAATSTSFDYLGIGNTQSRSLIINKSCFVFLDQFRKGKYIGDFSKSHRGQIGYLNSFPWDGEVVSGYVGYTDVTSVHFTSDNPNSTFLAARRADPRFAYNGGIPNDSGSALFYLAPANEMALVFLFHYSTQGPTCTAVCLNRLIKYANADAVARGHAAPPARTVTVAPDPML